MSHSNDSSNESLKSNQNNQKETIIQFNCTFNQKLFEIECKEIQRIFIKINEKRIEI